MKKQRGSKSKNKYGRLSTKIAKICSLILILIFTVVIATAIILSNRTITASIKNEFLTRSENISNKVESILLSARNSAEAVTSYLETAYVESAGQTVPEDTKEYLSEIYKVKISEKSKEVENYITETVRQSVRVNQDIVGIGVLFEPHAFDNNIKDYAFYISTQAVDDAIEPYIPYAEFSHNEYYAIPKETKEPFITAPYDDAGYKMVTYCIPIMYKDEFKGVITADINVSDFSKIVSDTNKFSSQYTTIVDLNGIVVFDTEDETNVGVNMMDFIQEDILAGIKSKMEGTEPFEVEIVRADGVNEISFYTPIITDGAKWWSITALEKNDMLASVRLMTTVLIIMAVISIIAIVAALFIIITKMLLPINAVVEAMESISHGSLDVSLQQKSNDEIGRLVSSFNETVTSLNEIIGDQSMLLEEMAQGNFNVESGAEEAYQGDYQKMLAAIKSISTQMSNALRQISQSSDQVSSGADQVSSGAQALSQGATEQASSVEELAATVNEISLRVKANAESAQKGSRLAESTGIKMEESNHQMQEMIAAMGEISEKSSQIGKIIKTIEDIAFQTNILALNAAVEAARAGMAGKGFAVVADEVRNLASKSAEASNNTAALIEDSIQAVEKGTQLAGETARTLSEVVESAGQVVTVVGEISKASTEQASSIAQVTQGIDQISSVVQTNSATAEESAAASEELSGQAQILKSLVGQFKLK